MPSLLSFPSALTGIFGIQLNVPLSLTIWLVCVGQPEPFKRNAVCNEKYKQGTAVRHDKYVFLLEGAPHKKIQRKEEKKEKSRQNHVQKDISAGPGIRLMFWYIGCTNARPPPIVPWQVTLSLSFFCSLACNARKCLLRWMVTQLEVKHAPPSPRAQPKVVSRREGKLPAPSHSGWERSRKLQHKYRPDRWWKMRERRGAKGERVWGKRRK